MQVPDSIPGTVQEFCKGFFCPSETHRTHLENFLTSLADSCAVELMSPSSITAFMDYIIVQNSVIQKEKRCMPNKVALFLKKLMESENLSELPSFPE